MDKIGGRKFIAFLISNIFLFIIFAVMLWKDFLNIENCKEIIRYIIIIFGSYVGGNSLSKFSKKLK